MATTPTTGFDDEDDDDAALGDELPSTADGASLIQPVRPAAPGCRGGENAMMRRGVDRGRTTCAARAILLGLTRRRPTDRSFAVPSHQVLSTQPQQQQSQSQSQRRPEDSSSSGG
jgi:hypothetical protein